MFTKKQRFERRIWLSTFIVESLICLALFLSLGEKSLPVAFALGGGCLAISLFIYHCAYKKPGTKFLTFYLLATPGHFGRQIFEDVNSGDFSITTWLIALPIAAITYYYAYRMRAINKELKTRRTAESSPQPDAS